MDTLGDGSLWMVDCAQGTVRQFALQPSRWGNVNHRRLSKISKVFITHMHADHVIGLITLLRDVLGFLKAQSDEGVNGGPAMYPPPNIEIYGPRGIRKFIRSLLTLTHSRSLDKCAAHELLFPGEEASVPIPGADDEPLHSSEVPGRDVWCDAEGYWRGVMEEKMGRGDFGTRVVMDAGPITPSSLVAARILVALGDTSDPTKMIPLIQQPFVEISSLTALDSKTSTTGASMTSMETAIQVPSKVALVIHECTDAYIPPEIDTKQRTGKNCRPDAVSERALEKGHSVPAMAGAFAKAVVAEKLVLNHIGTRFPAPPPQNKSYTEWLKFQHACIGEIERQALETFTPPPPQSGSFNDKRVIAAYDFLTIEIPPFKDGQDRHSHSTNYAGAQNNISSRGQSSSTHPRHERDENDRFKPEYKRESGTRRHRDEETRNHGASGGRNKGDKDSHGSSRKKHRR